MIRAGRRLEISGKLPINAMMISLQGVVNKNGPLVYILYPDNWPFTYVRSSSISTKPREHFTFQELRTPEQALNALKQFVKGMSYGQVGSDILIVAFTVAGLERAIVVSEELIPWRKKPD